MRRDGTDSPPEHRPTGGIDRRFRPEYRLRRRRDFERTLSGGTRLNAQAMTLVVRPNDVNHPRLGLAVSRRVSRRAVVRHRLKRRIRESFRHHAGHLAGLDVVVIARPGSETMDAERMRSVLAGAWQRAGVRARRAEGKRERKTGA